MVRTKNIFVKWGPLKCWLLTFHEHEDEVLPPTMSDPNLSQFRFKSKYRTQKRKRGTEFVYELRNVPSALFY